MAESVRLWAATTPSGLATQPWIEESRTLPFHFGGRKLFGVRFRASVISRGLEQACITPDNEEVRTRLSGHELALLFSYPTPSRLSRLAWTGTALRYVPRHYQRYFVETTGSFESYLQRFSAKSRQTLKRKVRRFCDRAGSAEPYRAFQSPEELALFHTLACPLSDKTYQARLLHAGLPASSGYLDQLISIGQSARGYLLFQGDAPVAYLFMPVWNGIATYKYVGYDPACAAWSPGAVLQYFALRCMFADPEIRLFDLAEGEAPHKAFFATGGVMCADIYYFRPTLKAIAAVAAHSVLGFVRSGLTRFLRLTRLESPIRHWTRRGGYTSYS